MYKAGQVFENNYPMEAAMWCNENDCHIAEKEPVNDVRQFVIQKNANTIPGETLAEAKQRATAAVNRQTSASIMAGFDYNGYHYNFDTYDQLNFNQLAMVDSDPVTIAAYKNGNKVTLTLTRANFLDVYKASADHKQKLIAEGIERKKAVAACTTTTQVNDLLVKYYG